MDNTIVNGGAITTNNGSVAIINSTYALGAP